MPLGIEQDSIAPQLIQNAGSALVQGIRQIGQQISSHLTEIQTKRDLAAMAQDMQGVNPQSTEFPVALTQLVSRHPLAAQDQRGLLALNILGKAHGEWQAGEAEARAFNRAMALQGYRSRAAQDLEAERQKRPIQVPKVGLVSPTEIDPVTGQAKVLVAAPPGAEPMPYRATPNGPFDQRTGTYGAPPPAPAPKPMTEYQKAQLRRAERKDKIAALNQEINQFEPDIASAVHQYESTKTRAANAPNEEERAKLDKMAGVIGSDADALRAEKQKRIALLKQLREEDQKDAAILPDNVAPDGDLGLPPVPANAAAAPAPIIGIKDGKRYEVDPVSKKVLRALP